MLRLGRGTWGFDCVFRNIRVQATAFSFLYMMVNTVGASEDPLQPSWRSPTRVDVSPVDFLALSKEIWPNDSLQTLPPGHGGARNTPWSHFDEFDVEKSVTWRSYSWFSFGLFSFGACVRVSNLLFILLLLLVFANVYCALLMQRWRAAWFISALFSNDLLFLNVVLLGVKPWLLIYLTMTCLKKKKV